MIHIMKFLLFCCATLYNIEKQRMATNYRTQIKKKKHDQGFFNFAPFVNKTCNFPNKCIHLSRPPRITTC